jgi:dCMP deaminase
MASDYAKRMSGCKKVAVGSVIVSCEGKPISLGANRVDFNLCKTKGCLREEKYGDYSRQHRNPDDCRAIHSELDAIASAQCDLSEATIFVTRYPCEACARAIAAAGIPKVVYGREQEISDMTKELFEGYGIEVIHESDYKEEDVTI